MSRLSVRTGRSAVLALLGLGTCALLVTPSWAESSATTRPATPAATHAANRHTGTPLGRNAYLLGCAGQPIGTTLRRGDCVQVIAHGFAAREQVQLRLMNTPTVLTRATADRCGLLSYRFTVSAREQSRDVLTMVGLGAPARATAGRPAGNVSVTVPRFAIVQFYVAGH